MSSLLEFHLMNLLSVTMEATQSHDQFLSLTLLSGPHRRLMLFTKAIFCPTQLIYRGYCLLGSGFLNFH